jgi:hypothetical protein
LLFCFFIAHVFECESSSRIDEFLALNNLACLLLSTSAGMTSRYAWVVYTLTIPFLIIFILLLNTQNSTDRQWPNLIGSYNIIQITWSRQFPDFTRNRVEGRYAAVRRDLGLDEQLIILPANNPDNPPIRTRNPSHRPRIKRALDFTLSDEAELSSGSSQADLPLSDDADNVPLTLTEDALWDYSNSKQTILDNFAQSVLRDEEEAAAATLAKSIRAKMRAKPKGKKRKSIESVRKSRPIIMVCFK